MIAVVLCLLPTLWEIWNDRDGETKKDKTRDLIVSVILYAAVALINWLLDIHPLKSLALTFGFRVLVFDYAVQWLLIRRGVIHGHWFTYTGKTARFDRLIARVNPWVRLAVRVVAFLASVSLVVFQAP